jgi:hypothetical protein
MPITKRNPERKPGDFWRTVVRVDYTVAQTLSSLLSIWSLVRTAM